MLSSSLLNENLTDILWENWDMSGKFPQVGDRVREYTDNEDSGSTTHGRDGDWIVTSIHQFSSFDTDRRIMVCYCSDQPLAPNWEKLQRGGNVAEMLQPTKVK